MTNETIQQEKYDSCAWMQGSATAYMVSRKEIVAGERSCGGLPTCCLRPDYSPPKPVATFHAETVNGANIPYHRIQDHYPHLIFAPGTVTDELLRHVFSLTRAGDWLNRSALNDAHDRRAIRSNLLSGSILTILVTLTNSSVVPRFSCVRLHHEMSS